MRPSSCRRLRPMPGSPAAPSPGRRGRGATALLGGCTTAPAVPKPRLRGAIVRGWAQTALAHTHVPRTTHTSVLKTIRGAPRTGEHHEGLQWEEKAEKKKEQEKKKDWCWTKSAPRSAGSTESAGMATPLLWCCRGLCSACRRHREITGIRVPAPWGLNGARTRGAELKALPPD